MHDTNNGRYKWFQHMHKTNSNFKHSRMASVRSSDWRLARQSVITATFKLVRVLNAFEKKKQAHLASR
jgi:hypothetical protein